MWGEGVECVQRSSRKYGERQTKDRQMDRERGRTRIVINEKFQVAVELVESEDNIQKVKGKPSNLFFNNKWKSHC